MASLFSSLALPMRSLPHSSVIVRSLQVSQHFAWKSTLLLGGILAHICRNAVNVYGQVRHLLGRISTSGRGSLPTDLATDSISGERDLFHSSHSSGRGSLPTDPLGGGGLGKERSGGGLQDLQGVWL